MLLLLLDRNRNETKPAEQPTRQRRAVRLMHGPGHTNLGGSRQQWGLGVLFLVIDPSPKALLRKKYVYFAKPPDALKDGPWERGKIFIRMQKVLQGGFHGFCGSGPAKGCSSPATTSSTLSGSQG